MNSVFVSVIIGKLKCEHPLLNLKFKNAVVYEHPKSLESPQKRHKVIWEYVIQDGCQYGGQCGGDEILRESVW